MQTTTKHAGGLALMRYLPILAIAAAAIAGFVFLRDYLSFEALAENRETLIAWRDSNYVLAVLAYMALYVGVVAFSLPGGLIMTLTGGFLFGLFPGALYIVVAATVGAVGIFLAAKMGLGDALAAKLEGSGGMAARVREGIRENEISYLFLMRLVPVVPFFAANLLPALAGVSLRNYAITTFLGIIPGTAVYTWVGSGLGEVFDRGEAPSLGIIWEWQVLGPILGLCVLAALPIVINSFKKKG